MKHEISNAIALTRKKEKLVKEGPEFFNRLPKIAGNRLHYFRVFVRF